MSVSQCAKGVKEKGKLIAEEHHIDRGGAGKCS
jgi:hypothetical protein